MNTNEELTINLCVPALRVADVPYNSAEAIKLINKLSGESQGFQLILFPQLSLSAYTCGDLFRLPLLARACLEALENIEAAVADRDCLVVLGLPLQIGDGLYDAAALVGGTGLQGFVLNQSPELPFFTSPVDIERDVLGWRERTVPILRDGYSFGRWAGKNISVQLGRMDADFQISKTEILLTPCALPALADIDYEEIFLRISSQQKGCLAVCSAGPGESTGQYVYSGLSQIWHQGNKLCDGQQLRFESQVQSLAITPEAALSERISTQPLSHARDKYNPFLFSSNVEKLLERAFEIQVTGLMGRMRHTGSRTMILGLSGGADSAMALMVSCRAADRLGLPRSSILAVIMPGPGSSDTSLERAKHLLDLTGVWGRFNTITDAVGQHLLALGHDLSPDLTFENAQARERTQFLMNYANMHQGLVVGTGDMSENALGWSTYNGDQMSMYNVNAGLPKTVLLRLLPWSAAYLFGEEGLRLAQQVIDAPISPELQPTNAAGQTEQVTEEVLGPYRLHDFFLWHAIGQKRDPKEVFALARMTFKDEYAPKFILNSLRTFYQRFFRHQFKRTAAPDGPQLFTVGLDARSGWGMPADAKPDLWLAELDKIENTLQIREQ